MTTCAMCDGKGRIDKLESELCAFCGGSGRYTPKEDGEAIAMLDNASDQTEVKAGDMALISDYLRMAKRRV